MKLSIPLAMTGAAGTAAVATAVIVIAAAGGTTAVGLAPAAAKTTAAASATPTKNCNGVGNPDCATSAKQFTITQVGTVANLAMGHPSQVNVLITNANAQDIHILSLTATAGDPPAPNPKPNPASLLCTAARDLRITAYSATATNAPQYTVLGNRTLTMSLPIALVNLPSQNQNLCKGVTFPLSFSGTAEQVH